MILLAHLLQILTFNHSTLRTKKSFGQHLLNDEELARQIVAAMVDRYPSTPLLEIGPGTGVLTKYLVEKEMPFKAVEADKDMVTYLQKNLGLQDDQLIELDVLRLNFQRLWDGQALNVIGNFPYNISTQIIIRVLKYKELVPSVVGMFQKEVGDRICAAPGSKTYGKISAWAQAFYDCKVIFDVPPHKFDPPPKVQSVVIQMDRKENLSLGCDEKLYVSVVKQAFSQRRKMLRNTLKGMLKGTDLMNDPFFTRRPETLSVEEFIDITKKIEVHQND